MRSSLASALLRGCFLAKAIVPIYRPLLYCLVVLILCFQTYVIWQDRLNAISLVTYSYGSGYDRNMDTAFVNDIRYSGDYINAIVLIQEKTNRQNIMIHSWQRLYKDRATVVEWQNK